MKKYVILTIITTFISIIVITFIKYEPVEMPKVYLYGKVTELKNKKEKINIKIKYEAKNKVFDSNAKIKLQGASSLQYPKKNFNITFYDEKYDKKEDFNIKWGNISKYTLKADWIDNTHSRNVVTAKIYSEIQNKYNLFTNEINNGVVDGFPIELYINDEFYGLYTLNIHKDYLFNLNKNNPNNLLFVSKSNSSVSNFRMTEKTLNSNFELEFGVETEETLNKLNRLINFIKSSTDEEFKEHFEEYIDLDAALNYYCYMMFASLVDNSDNNLLLVTYDGKKWYPSLYDLDLSWGISRTSETIPYDYDMEYARKKSKLWRRLEENFPTEISTRYFELRKEILTKENVLKEFSNYQQLISKSIQRKDIKKWKIEEKNNYKQIKKYLEKRIPYVDSEMKKLKK